MKKINKKGFTLVELLAVIVVLAIIMVIVVPSVTESLNNAKQSSFLIYAQKMLNAASQQYHSDLLEDSMPLEYCYNIEYLSEGSSSSYKGFVKVVIENDETKTYISMFDKNYSVGITSVNNEHTFSGISFAEIEQFKNNSSKSINKGGNFTLTSPCSSSNTKGDATIIGKEETSSSTQEITTVTRTKASELISSLVGKDSSLITDDDKNIRYVGSSPNNYIKIDSMDYRIIGVFENEGEKVVKVIKSQFNNDNPVSYWDETGSSDWENSSLYSYLNEKYYNKLSQVKQYSYLSSWKLGGDNPYATGNISNLLVRENDKTCKAYVGLMSASDFIYASNSETCKEDVSSSSCINDNWLYYSSDEWVINNDSSDPYYVMYISKGEGLSRSFSSEAKRIARPTIYLNPNIIITGGTGTQSDQYIISL